MSSKIYEGNGYGYILKKLIIYVLIACLISYEKWV